MNLEERKAILGGVLLAAGPSSRLGQSKQLVRLDGESLARRSARLMLDVGLDNVTVVCGCRADQVQDELVNLPVGTVFNRDWEQGMGSSINCGVRSMPQGVDGRVDVGARMMAEAPHRGEAHVAVEVVHQHALRRGLVDAVVTVMLPEPVLTSRSTGPLTSRVLSNDPSTAASAPPESAMSRAPKTAVASSSAFRLWFLMAQYLLT